MDYFRDAMIMERVLQCAAAKAKLDEVKKRILNRRIKAVEFSNEGAAVGILLTLDDRQQITVLMKELSLHLLLRDHEIDWQERQIALARYTYRIPRRGKGKKP